MGYNYGKEVQRLRCRQLQEDERLRSAGVSEDFIEILHELDWDELKANRIYYTHNVRSIDDLPNSSAPVERIEALMEDTVASIEELLNHVGNPRLHCILMAADRLTLHALLLKMQGYSIDEISVLLDLSKENIYKRLQRIRKKINQTL